MMTRTPTPNKARGIFRRDGGPLRLAATELSSEFLSEPGPGPVALDSKCWVATPSIRSFNLRVSSSEVITALVAVTVAPHCRQKFASGISSAPHVEQRGMLITNKITPRFVLSKPVPLLIIGYSGKIVATDFFLSVCDNESSCQSLLGGGEPDASLSG